MPLSGESIEQNHAMIMEIGLQSISTEMRVPILTN